MDTTSTTSGMTPAERLRFYVTGAIERGEGLPILEHVDGETDDEYAARRARAAAAIRASVERSDWRPGS